MKIEAQTREEYFAAAGNAEPELRELDALIREHAPDLTPGLTPSGATMLGYGSQPYQSKSMRSPGTWPVLVLAAQKHHLSLYVCVLADGAYLAETYADRLGVDCGRSCVRFKRVSDLNPDGLRDLLVEVNERAVTGNLTYGM